MSRKYIIAASLAGALVLTLVVRVSTGCSCVPALKATEYSPSLGAAFREIAGAQDSVRRNVGRYAETVSELGPVRLPPDTRIIRILRSDTSYRVRIDSAGTRSCIVSGGSR